MFMAGFLPLRAAWACDDMPLKTKEETVEMGTQAPSIRCFRPKPFFMPRAGRAVPDSTVGRNRRSSASNGGTVCSQIK